MGKVFKYNDDVDTDVIIPARYLNDPNPKSLAKHCMEDIDSEFANKVKENDFILAGYNFGCGSSREHAPIAIKASGIKCVIAKSFARIFYRNAINTALPILESKEAYNKIDNCDEIEVDLEKGIIINLTKKEEYKAAPFPDFIKDIIKCNGYLNYLGKKNEV